VYIDELEKFNIIPVHRKICEPIYKENYVRIN